MRPESLAQPPLRGPRRHRSSVGFGLAGYEVGHGGVGHTAAACIAVGEYLKLVSDTNVALAERWDGRSWRRLVPVTPGYRAILEAVVCPRADRCVAVGQYYNLAGVGFTLAEGWNGTTWTVQSTPNP